MWQFLRNLLKFHKNRLFVLSPHIYRAHDHARLQLIWPEKREEKLWKENYAIVLDAPPRHQQWLF